jgi:predicted nucleic acid-binding Zn ribbon protein
MTTFPSPLEQWTKLFQEAERLLSEVVERVAERQSVPASLPVELRQRTAEIRRKVSILQTKMGLMQEELSKLSSKQNMYTLLRIDPISVFLISFFFARTVFLISYRLIVLY